MILKYNVYCGGFIIFSKKHSVFLILLALLSIFLMASVSAADLNTTDEIVSDSVEEVVAIENSDGLISVEDAGNFTVVESDFEDELSVNNNSEDVLGVDNNFEDELSVNNESEVLGKTYTVSNGGNLGSTIGSASSGDIIIINEGSYYIKDFKITKSLTFIGQGNVLLTTNNGGDKSMFLIGADVTFKNIRFQGGSAQWGNIFYVYSGLLTVDNCKFEKGLADKGGGSINCFDSGRCRVLNSQFYSGSVSNGYGGAIYIESYGEVINCTFNGNSAKYGGAIRISKAPNSIIDNCTFISCSANHGGAIHIDEGSSNVKITNSVFKSCGSSESNSAIDVYNVNLISIEGCEFVSCSSSWGTIGFWGTVSNINIYDSQFSDCSSNNRGGAIYWESGTNLNVNNCKFTNVHASSYGGAIEAHGTTNLNVLKCDFTNCYSTKDNGGAIHTDSINTVNVLNSSFVDNSVVNCGGAIDVYNSNNLDIFNCNFTDCTAGQDGGAVFNTNTFNVNVIGCNFDSCKSNGFAGSLRIVNSKNKVNISDCSFSNSYCNLEGGSIYCKEINDLAISCCDFLNSSSNLTGGAILIWIASNADLDNLLFKDSNSNNWAGSIYLYNVTKFKLCNSDFINSHAAESGGAIHVNPSGDLNITCCSFDNCSAEFNGNALDFVNVENILVDKSNFTNVNYKNHDSIFFESEKYEIWDCIFDVYPTVSYHYTSFLNVDDLVIDDDGFLVVSLSDVRGILANKIIRLNVGGNEYQVDSSQGDVILNIMDYVSNVGKYIFNFDYDGDDINNPVSKNVSVIITDYSVLNVDDLSLRIGEDGFLVANLTDSHNPLVNQSISFVVDGNSYNVSTNQDGLAVLKINDYLSEPGEYIVNVNFKGNEFIDSCSKDVNVFIKYAPVLNVEDVFVIKGDEVTLSVVLSDTQYISNKDITFTVNGKKYFSKTDLNGLVILNVSDYLTEYGDYPVEVSYGGDEFDYPVSANVTVHIIRYFANLTIEQVGKYYGETNLTFRLANSKTNESIEGAPVTVILANNAPKPLFTDKNGMVTYEVALTPGNYNVTASVSLPYVRVNDAELNFEVSKFIGEIEITQDVNSRLLHVRVFNRDNGDVFKNFTVVLHFEPNTEFAKLLTDENGCVNFTIPYDEGDYNVTASITGQYMEFTPCTLENIAVNSNMNSQISFNKYNFTFNYLESDSIYAGVYGCSLELKNISVEGHPEAAIKLESGVITLSNLSAGNYVLHIRTTPDYGYNSVTYRLDVFVNKIKSKIIFAGSGISDWGESCILPVFVDGGWFDLENISVVGHTEANISLEGSNIVISNLSAGNYTLNVKTTPDGNHTSVEANKTITVNKISSRLTFEDNAIEFDYWGSGSVNFTANGCSIDSKNIYVENYPDVVINVTGNRIIVSGLDAGEYTLHATSAPDENHSAVAASIDVIVNRIDSNVQFGEPIVYYYGKTGSTIITLDGSIGLSSCSVDNQNAEIDVTYVDVNKRLITVSGLPVGNYTLRVKTNPDKNHNSIEKTTGITIVSVYSTVILGGNLTFPYGKSDFTTVHVEGGHVDYENISVVNHTEAEISFKSNVITVSNLTAGNYTLRVISTPDNDHTSSVATALIVVEKINSKITFIDDLSFEYGSEDSTYVIVDGGWVDDGNASVVGHDANVAVVNNKITVSGLDVGTYTLRVVSTPDENHLSIENSLDFEVTKADSKVICDKEIAFDYEKSDFTSVRVEGGTMDFNSIHMENGMGNITVTPNSNIITVSNLTVGSYVLCVPTIPDSNHNSVVGRINVTVRPVASKVNFTNSLVFDYLKSDFTYITVEGADLSKTKIYVDGYPDAPVDLDGNKITVSGLNPGSYTLCAVTSPDDNHYSADKNLSITVNKVSALLNAPKASVYYNSGNVWNVKLYDGKTKDPLANMKVTFKVYSGTKLYKSFSMTTNAKGIASVKVSTWTVGAHKVVVSFSKDGYKSASANNVVTILKTPVVITAPKLSVYLKTAKKWSIKVVDSKTKKAIASTKLTLKVYTGKKYKSYSVKTNSKGVATFATSSLAVGTHKVVVSFSKTGYVSKSVASSIVVKPIPLTIKGDFSYGSSGSTVRVTVTNKLTGKPANGISVKLIVYTGSKITKSYTLVTANYKTYKGFVGFGTNAFSVGTHKVVIKPISNMYSGQGTTSLVIKSGAANGGTYYSFVSRGKLTLA